MKRLLIFHPTIAPYRIDFFNQLFQVFDCRICLSYRFTLFDYEKIEKELLFTPVYITNKTDYWKQLDEFNPDIVMTGEFGLSTIIPIIHRKVKKKGYKIVSICDDSHDMIANDNDFSIKHKIARKVITPLIDDLVVVEPKVKDWYFHHYGKGIFFPIIRDGDKARETYERLLPKSKALIQKHHLEDKNVFLFVGRLVAIKNVPALLYAFSKLDQTNNVLVIIGSGEEEDSLKKQAHATCSQTIFTGRLEGDDLYAWYNVADYFVLPSTKEAFGAVTNEALLAGCYCLVSSKAGSACLIEDKKNGEVFYPHNIAELTKKMVALASKKPQKDITDMREDNMIYSFRERMSNLIACLNRLS